MTTTRHLPADTLRHWAAAGFEAVGMPADDAARYLEQADRDVKTAILLGLGLDLSEAAQLLQRHGGNLRSAINESKRDNG